MRKIVFVMAIVFLISFSCSFAESFDVSNMSTEDLFSLKAAIEEEFKARGVYESELMTPGAYVVGIDIVEGEYLFSLDPSVERGSATIYLYESEEAVANGEPIDECTAGDSFKGRLGLKNGNVLKVYNNSCIPERTSKASWAP